MTKRKSKILIVDDNPQNLYMLQVLLQGNGYEVVSATNGAEALDKARRDPPDVIISDILMPVMDGFTLCRQWMKDDRLKAIPFVFYTATYTDPRDEELALSLGAARFIVKPVEPEVFAEMVREIIKEAREGRLVAPRKPIEEEPVYLKEYSERLVKKLEDKMLQLEEANRDLKREITERVRAEEALRESEARYRSVVNDILDSSAVGLIILDSDFRVVWVNQALERCFGLRRDEIVGEDKRQLIRDRIKGIFEDPTNFAEKVLATYDDNTYIEHFECHVLPDDERQERWLEHRSQPIRTGLYLGGRIEHYYDITERKRAGEELRVSEAKYQDLYNNAPDMFVSVDAQTAEIVQCNQTLVTVLGYSKEEIIGRPVFDVYHPDCMESVKSAFQLFVETGEVHDAELQLKRKDGSKIDVSLAVSAVRDEQGEILYSRSIWRDITERKRAEEALRTSRASLLEAQRIAHLGNWDWNIEKNVLLWSDEIYRIFGLEPQEFGATYEAFLDSVHPDDRELVTNSVNEALDGKPYSIDHRIVLPDGSERAVHEQAEVYYDQAGKPIRMIGTVQDITERVRHEREQAAMVTVANALRVASTREEMLPIILEQLLILLNADGAVFEMLDPVSGELLTELGRGVWAAATGDRIPPGAGLSAQVVATGRPYLNNDARSDPRPWRPELLGDCCAVAGVPLLAQEQIIGLLWVARKSDITEEHVRLLTAVADIAANAIHRAALHEQTEKRLRRLDALRNIDIAISGSLDLRITFEVLLDQVVSQLEVDAADVLLLNPHTRTLEYGAGRGFRGTGITRTRLRLGEGYAGRAAFERRMVSIPNLPESDPDFLRAQALAGEGFVAYYGAPLLAKGQVQGVLEVFHRAPLAPDPEWLGFLDTLAGQAAIAIDNVTLFDDLQRSNVELIMAYDTTLEGWSQAMDLRDKETEGHTQRVTEMAVAMARAMGMSEAELVHVRRGGLLHDMGKLGIPDSILLKPGPLTDEEWAIMRQHPVYAYQFLSPIAYLRPAVDVPYSRIPKVIPTFCPLALRAPCDIGNRQTELVSLQKSV